MTQHLTVFPDLGDPGAKLLHPASTGTDITLTGTVTAEQVTSTDDITAAGTIEAEHLDSTDDASVSDDLIVEGGISVGNTDGPLTGQIKVGVAAGSGYVTGYAGAYVPLHIDGSEILFDISGTEKAKLLADGSFRMANAEYFKSLNAAGNADLTVAGYDSSNNLILGSALTGVVKAASSVITAATVVNADVSASAAIAPSKVAIAPFSAFLSAATSNDKTGNGDAYTVICNTEITATADYNNSTGVFTAPATGAYEFVVVLDFDGLNAATYTDLYIDIVTSNRTWRVFRANPNNLRVSNTISIGGSCIADMDQSDTAYVQVIVSGGTKSVGLIGNASTALTFFSGARLL